MIFRAGKFLVKAVVLRAKTALYMASTQKIQFHVWKMMSNKRERNKRYVGKLQGIFIINPLGIQEKYWINPGEIHMSICNLIVCLSLEKVWLTWTSLRVTTEQNAKTPKY